MKLQLTDAHRRHLTAVHGPQPDAAWLATLRKADIEPLDLTEAEWHSSPLPFRSVDRPVLYRLGRALILVQHHDLRTMRVGILGGDRRWHLTLHHPTRPPNAADIRELREALLPPGVLFVIPMLARGETPDDRRTMVHLWESWDDTLAQVVKEAGLSGLLAQDRTDPPAPPAAPALDAAPSIDALGDRLEAEVLAGRPALDRVTAALDVGEATLQDGDREVPLGRAIVADVDTQCPFRAADLDLRSDTPGDVGVDTSRRCILPNGHDEEHRFDVPNSGCSAIHGMRFCVRVRNHDGPHYFGQGDHS